MRRLLFAAALLAWAAPAWGQCVQGPGQPTGISGCPAALNIQPTDLVLMMQLPPGVGQTISGIGSTRKATVSQLGTAAVGSTFSSPPPLGNVAPNTGAFTSLGITGAGTALSVTNNYTLGGVGTFGSAGQNTLTFTPGATTSATSIASIAGAGGLTFRGGPFIVNNGSNFGNGGTFTLSGSSINFTQFPFLTFANSTGSTTAAEVPLLAYFVNSTWNVAGGASTIQDGIFMTVNCCGSSSRAGGYNTLSTAMNVTTMTGDFAAGGSPAFQAWQCTIRAAVNQGGTSTVPYQAYGQNWCTDSVASLGTGATNQQLLINFEGDMAIQTGASASRKIDIAAYNSVKDTLRGAAFDSAFNIGTNTGATYSSNRGWLNGITFGGWVTGFFGDVDSTAIAAWYSQDHLTNNTGKWFIDALEPTWSSGVLRSNGIVIDGSGNVNPGTGTFGPTSTGVALDAGNYIVTAVALNAAGQNYIVGDPLDYGNGGRTSVLTTTVDSSPLPTIRNGGTGGTPGTQTVTATDAAFSVPAQFNVTVSAGGVITGVNSVSVAGTITGAIGTDIGGRYTTVSGAGLTGASLYVTEGVASITGLDRAAVASSAVCTTGCATTTWGRTNGTGATVNLTWQQRATLGIGPTLATAITIGNSGSTTAFAGAVKFPALGTAGAVSPSFTTAPTGCSSVVWVGPFTAGAQANIYLAGCHT